MNSHLKWPVKIIQLLSVIGLLVAWYLYLYHEQVITTQCGDGGFFDCSQVSGPSSPYSTIGETSIAAIGLAGYALFFLLIWGESFSKMLARYLDSLLLLFAGGGLLFTLYLKGLELFVIEAMCEYCLYSAIIMLLIFLLALFNFFRPSKKPIQG